MNLSKIKSNSFPLSAVPTKQKNHEVFTVGSEIEYIRFNPEKRPGTFLFKPFTVILGNGHFSCFHDAFKLFGTFDFWKSRVIGLS